MDERSAGIMKFDVIVGNPPYMGQEKSQKTSRFSEASDKRKWEKFYKTFFRSADYAAVVLPSSWLGRLNDPMRKDLHADKHIEYIIDVTPYFDKKKVTYDTLALIRNKEFSSDIKNVIRSNGHQHKILATEIKSLRNTDETNVILTKLQSTANIGAIRRRVADIKQNMLSNNPSNYPVIIGMGSRTNPLPRLMYGKEEYIKQQHMIDKPKVVFNTHAQSPDVHDLGPIKIVPKGFITSGDIIFIPCDYEQTCNNIKVYFESKLVKFIIKTVRTAINNSKTLLAHIPCVDFTRSWTDEELYAHFNLTDEEIKMIESFVK